MENLSVLSQQSVDHLRMVCSNGIDILKFDFYDLKNEFNLFEVDTQIEFERVIAESW